MFILECFAFVVVFRFFGGFRHYFVGIPAVVSLVPKDEAFYGSESTKKEHGLWARSFLHPKGTDLQFIHSASTNAPCHPVPPPPGSLLMKGANVVPNVVHNVVPLMA
jgi:hypothetical protein